MVFLGKYEELAPGMGFPAMRDSFAAKPYSTKAEVLSYLKSGKTHIATAARIVDVISGERTFIPLVHMNDGEYTWTSKLIYYIDRYNLRLPEDVERRILQKGSVKH